MDTEWCLYTTEGEQCWRSVQDVMNSLGSLTLFNDGQKELATLATATSATETGDNGRKRKKTFEPTDQNNGWLTTSDVSYSAGRGERLRQLENRMKPMMKDMEMQSQLRQVCGMGYSNELIEHYWSNHSNAPTAVGSVDSDGQFDDSVNCASADSRWSDSNNTKAGRKSSRRVPKPWVGGSPNLLPSQEPQPAWWEVPSDIAIAIETSIGFKPKAASPKRLKQDSFSREVGFTSEAIPTDGSQEVAEPTSSDSNPLPETPPLTPRLPPDQPPDSDATHKEDPGSNSGSEVDDRTFLNTPNSGETKLAEERSDENGLGNGFGNSAVKSGQEEGSKPPLKVSTKKRHLLKKTPPRCRNALLMGLELTKSAQETSSDFPPLLKRPEHFLQPATVPCYQAALSQTEFSLNNLEFPPL